MNSLVVMLTLLTACARLVHTPAESPKRFVLDVPPGAASRPTYLVLHDLTVARNTPLVVRARAFLPDSSTVALGSAGIQGVARDATGTTTQELRINVTTGLRRWMSMAPKAIQVEVELRAGGDSASATSVSWSVRSATFVHP